MHAPNPFSFKNFSQEKSLLSPVVIYISFCLMGAGIAGGVWFLKAKFAPPQKKSAIVRGAVSACPQIKTPPKKLTPKPVKETYADFEAGESFDIETEEAEEESRFVQEKESDLVRLFKSQEKKAAPFFAQQKPWQKNAKRSVRAPPGKRMVALVINGVEDLSPQEWVYIRKMNIPLTFVFDGQKKKGALAEKAWKKGREILVKGPASYSKRFPKRIGVVALKGAKEDSYLRLSRLKGLVGGRPHKLFTFPLVQEQAAFLKNKRSVLWITPRPQRLRNLFDWMRRNKKKVAFIPLSQIYGMSAERPIKKGKLLDLKKIKNNRLRTV